MAWKAGLVSGPRTNKPMKITVRLFARARDLAGSDRAEIEVSEPATVGELRAALAAQKPALAPLVPQLFVALNNDYAEDDATIRATDEVACFPPVSGG